MLDFLSNRATAAHLALAAVAPLVLCEYVSTGAVGPVLVWLSVIAAVWAFMAPVKLQDERTPEARCRFLSHSFSDPFFWFSAALVVYAAVVALNSGAALTYDVELKLWKLVSPTAAMLPGSVDGAGSIHFCSTLLVFALYSAVAHSLDSRQSVYFAIVASFVVVLDAVLAYASGVDIGGGNAVAYGLWSLVAAAAMFSAESSRRRPKELLSAMVLAGCLAALLFTLRPVVTIVFVSAVLLLALAFIAFRFRDLGVIGVARTLLMLFVAVSIAAILYHWRSGGDWQSQVPVWGCGIDHLFNRFSVLVWEANPWTGSGLGSFPLVTKFYATPEDWAAMGPVPDFGGNGWRILLAERGMIGVLAVAGSFGAMAFSWFRYARQRGMDGISAAVPLLPIAMIAVSVVMMFDSSALQVGAVVAFVSLAAFSINGGQ